MKTKKFMAGILAAAAVMTTGAASFAAHVSYKDVDSSQWYAPAVEIVTKHNLMVGIGDDKFAPNNSTSRAMVVQVLYNQAGSPKVSGKAAFTDVKKGEWYYNAIQWAAKNGIAAGVGNGKFAPNKSVTRQELARFLYETVGEPSVSGKLNFPDSGKVADWAESSMLWATQNGIVHGSKDGGKIWLKPTHTATRAEIAQMLIGYLDVSTPGHDYKEEITTEATCEMEGTKTLTCSICGKQKIETIPALEHKIVVDEAVDPTCTEPGKTEGSHCSVCKKIIHEQKVIPAIGHDYKRTTVKDPTCSAEGQAKHICDKCGDSYIESIPATGKHTYTDKVTKEATCTVDGERTFTCSVCGDSYTESIPATGHDYESEITTPATDTSNGVKTYTCKKCGDTYMEVIPATGHVYEKTITKEATCTEDGLETYACTLCDDTYTEVIPALGHDYESKITKVATCTEEGEVTYTCKRCGDSYTLAVPTIGHDWIEQTTQVWVVDQEAYDEEVVTGYRKYYQCTGCDKKFYFDQYPESEDDTSPGQANACIAVSDHLFECSADTAGYTLKKDPVYDTIHHDEVGHYETKVTGYKCSHCGEVVESVEP